MENANPSCSTSNKEFLYPMKKEEIESWLGDSRIIDSLDESNKIEYFDTFPTVEELEYHEQAYIDLESPINVMSKQHYDMVISKGLESRQKPSNPKDTTSIIDHHLGEVVFGKPFAWNTGLIYDQEEGTVTLEKDDEKITFKMPHKMETFNQIDFKDINTDFVPPFVLKGNDDRGKTYYSDSLTLGPEYREDESIRKEIRNLMKLEREANRHKGEVMKRISEKRIKNEAKNDKTEHGMEKREKTKSNRSQSQQKSK
ncbi:hypothetical protein Tco_0800842 [Tanacetum coccineum]|uniref:Uncharacterized protein n=1 Tax=Tanacetum coccineum TaxID=301880 RepID=A0ABQ4ZUA1_9ASTR